MSIGQTVKNAGRLRQIAVVLGSHGLSQLVETLGLGRFVSVPRKFEVDEHEASRPIAWRLRKSMEELGPTFIKLGQLLSNRPDIVPASWVDEFKHLQDDVASSDFASMKKQVEEELGASLGELFKEVDPNPLATASIAQVHAAKLLDGTPVVLKIQKPGIEETILTDMSLLLFIASLIERTLPDLKLFDPTGFVDEFSSNIRRELDFTLEGSNAEKIRGILEEIPEIVIPKIHWEYTSKRVLCMERLEGIKLADMEALDRAGFDRVELARIGAEGIFRQVLGDGFFHADMHAGNIFAMEGNRLGLMDFGMVGRVTPEMKEALGAIFLAVLTEDYDGMVHEFLVLSGATLTYETERAIVKKVRRIVEPHLGGPISEFPVVEVLVELGQIGMANGVSVPSDLLMLLKVLMELEGMGKRLDPDFNFMEYGQRFTQELMMERFSPARLGREAWKTFKSFQELSSSFPKQMNELLRRLNREAIRMDIETPQIRQLERSVRGAGWIVAVGIVASIFWASGVALRIAGVMPYFASLNLLLGGGAMGLGVVGALWWWRKQKR